ncbi:MAG: hypothetical protein KDA84_23545 [Planctomycetaceae bacterium]|nr:hypothetical protein [Planctomycetaceae bacterium]
MSSSLFLDSSLPPDLDNRVQSELRDGERLLWVGQPIPARYGRKGTPLMIFGGVFTAFSLFWIVMALTIGGFAGANGLGWIGLIFPLFGVPFVLVGAGMLSAPFWMKKLAAQTFYAITDRRVILWEAGLFGRMEVRSYDPSQLKTIRRVEYANGEGDLILEEFVTYGRDSDGHRTRHRKLHGLMAIAHVRDVEELIHRALVAPIESNQGST